MPSPVPVAAEADDADPMISINPGNGGTVHPGGTIFVDNWTNQPASVEIVLDDGTVLFTGFIPAQSHHDYQVPNNPDLVGRKIKVKAKAGPTSAEADITIK